MILFPLFLAGHLIGDWVFQTDRDAQYKTMSWKTNQHHMLTYHIALMGFSAWALNPLSVLILLSISWVTHSIIDRRWPVVWLMQRTGSYQFATQYWGVIAVDQALHLSILSVLSVVLR
jgi:hypothetical protein